MKLRYSLMLGALLILAGTSCEDKLDIPQKGVLDFSTYYKTDEQAQAAADALYIQLKGTYYNYTMMKNALSDDVWAGGGGRNDNAELEGCNEYSFGSDQSFIGGVWESYYQLIYKANVILGRVEPDTDLKKKACAEAKFFRAFAYFDLVSMWGDVPLVDHELRFERLHFWLILIQLIGSILIYVSIAAFNPITATIIDNANVMIAA
jgi:hypothetical protein